MTEADGARLRAAVVGVSVRERCGVHDYAQTLAAGMRERGVAGGQHWLTRAGGQSLANERAEFDRWVAQLGEALRAEAPDAVVLHYSVFSYSYKGVPLLTGRLLALLHSLGAPVLTVLHEFAYPWRYGGWRGTVWAVSQRAALPRLLRTSAGVLVTADFRATWLRSRRWLPARPVEVAPVFSSLPAASPGAEPAGEDAVGLFGYSYQGAAVTLVLDALRQLREEGRPVRLCLLGAPGPDSQAGDEWRAGAAERGVADALEFSGPLPAQELSDALARSDVLLFADTAGPASRKTTLASSLASGRPVVALDGPTAWPALLDSGAARVVAPSATALAGAVGALLSDADTRSELGGSGAGFYEREMSVGRSVDVALELLGQITAARRP